MSVLMWLCGSLHSLPPLPQPVVRGAGLGRCREAWVSWNREMDVCVTLSDRATDSRKRSKQVGRGQQRWPRPGSEHSLGEEEPLVLTQAWALSCFELPAHQLYEFYSLPWSLLGLRFNPRSRCYNWLPSCSISRQDTSVFPAVQWEWYPRLLDCCVGIGNSQAKGLGWGRLIVLREPDAFHLLFVRASAPMGRVGPSIRGGFFLPIDLLHWILLCIQLKVS